MYNHFSFLNAKFRTISRASYNRRSGNEIAMSFLYPSAFPASAIISPAVESISTMATDEWYAGSHYAVFRFDIGEFAQGECLDMALSNLSSGCTLTTTAAPLVNPSLTNQFLDIIPPAGLSYS